MPPRYSHMAKKSFSAISCASVTFSITTVSVRLTLSLISFVLFLPLNLTLISYKLLRRADQCLHIPAYLHLEFEDEVVIQRRVGESLPVLPPPFHIPLYGEVR